MLDGSDPSEELNRQDTNHDGGVSLQEHLDDDKNITPEEIQDRTEMFRVADVNGDGVLDKSEMTSILAPETIDHMLPTVVKHSMRKHDKNKDGKITFDEFQEGDFAEKANIAGDDAEEKSADNNAQDQADPE